MSPSALLLQKILISGGLLVSYIGFFGIVQFEKYFQGGVIINKQEENTQDISPPGALQFKPFLSAGTRNLNLRR